MSDAPIGSARKWVITLSVMLVTVMQVLDTSITNVVLPHMQGSFSASIDEMSWVITSYLADNWSWRWVFYINLPIGILAFFMVSAFLFDAPFHRRPRHVDLAGIVLMVLGFGCLQLVLDLGERRDWFDSALILTLAALAACMLAGFVIRELVAAEPILD